jgi:hypothetical protein
MNKYAMTHYEQPAQYYPKKKKELSLIKQSTLYKEQEPMSNQYEDMEFVAHPPGTSKKLSIDMRAGFPPVKMAKQMQKLAPKCWNLFFGKKYILPNYRAPYYSPQDFINYLEFNTLVGLPYSNYRDDIMTAAFCNTAGSLYLNRPTLFLEHELGARLLNAPLPEDMSADDFKWKWPAFRIYLPDRLVNLDEHHWLMFMDLSLLEEEEGRCVPPDVAAELDNYTATVHPSIQSNLSFQNFTFHYPDRAIVVSGILNCVDGTTESDLTAYAIVKPFKAYSVREIKAMTEHLKSAWACDLADDAVSRQMEHLALQCLLFLGAFPLEYEQRVARKPGMAGSRQITGLYYAKFVGSSQIRPKPGEPHHIASAAQVIAASGPGNILSYERGGWHLSPHWRSGHWVRQPYGPGSRLRKLIWVNTMPVGFGEPTAEGNLTAPGTAKSEDT